MSHLPLVVAGPLRRTAVNSVAAGGLRLAVLVWLVLSQFPLPVLHSHETLRDSVLTAHLARHHQIDAAVAAQHTVDCNAAVFEVYECQELHWHLFLPSDFLARGTDEMNGPHSASFSPLGIWGEDGDSVVDHDSAIVWSLLHAYALNRWVVVGNPDVAVPPSPDSLPSHSFTQTYLDVPLCTLVCVMRT
ncbi:hypothetical protein [Novipirellula maiorica]|uniref:hypothetical protein n=1 Tax=Novipirellula maiorica TaxID=1265734 RepID=UPI001181C4D9|nr:hypothetical protein [Rhodopirellula maiorica]